MTSSEAPVEVVAYDPSWPARFEEEEKALRRALAAWLVGSIEHIGREAYTVAKGPFIARITGLALQER